MGNINVIQQPMQASRYANPNITGSITVVLFAFLFTLSILDLPNCTGEVDKLVLCHHEYQFSLDKLCRLTCWVIQQ